MPDAPPTPLRLWLLAALALAEPLLLGVWFDAENLVKLGGWAGLVANASVLLRVGTSALLALIVILTARQTSLQAEREAVLTHGPSVAPWVLHALSYAALFLTSTRVFSLSGHTSTELAPPTPSLLWLLLWLVTAVGTALTLGSLLAPPHVWIQAIRRHANVVFYSLIVGLAIWLLGLGSDKLWVPLGGLTLEATARLLDIIEPEIIVAPHASIIATPHFGVEVAPECSGFEGMGLMAAFLVVVAIAGRSRLRMGRVLMLLPFAVAGMWLTNAFRIAALIWLGSNVSAPLAMGAFHSKAGWFLFCAVALAFLSFIHRSQFFQRASSAPVATESHDPSQDTYNPTFVYLLPLVAQLATSLLTSTFAPHIDLAYGARILTIGTALWWVRRDLPSFELSLHWGPVVSGVLGYLLWTALYQPPEVPYIWTSKLQPEESARTILEALPPIGYWSWIIARMIGSVVFVPIAEELAFRGFLLPRLISANFTSVSPRKLTVVALFVSSLVFGLLHEQWLAGTLCGVLFALARWYRGRLRDAILAHALTNALLAADVLFRGHWHHWV